MVYDGPLLGCLFVGGLFLDVSQAPERTNLLPLFYLIFISLN